MLKIVNVIFTYSGGSEMRDITLSNKTYKLEHEPYIYKLQDVEEPELFREMFPYTETPKVAFNY